MKFCGEIAYLRKEDDGFGYESVVSVHSDICLNCSPKAPDGEVTDDYRKFLHDCLDEWLNKANGNGAFWVGDPDYFKDWE